MKPVLLLFAFVASTFHANAQDDNWTVSHNKKTQLKVVSENKAKNIVNLKAAAITKTGSLVISFHHTPAESIRAIKIFDGADQQEIFNLNDRAQLTLTNAELKKLFGEAKQVHVYTLLTPRDPAKAAAVRLRRMHVCTINLK
jgi:hypothetical protein